MSNFKNAVLGAALFAFGATPVAAADHEFKLHHFIGEKAPAHAQIAGALGKAR